MQNHGNLYQNECSRDSIVDGKLLRWGQPLSAVCRASEALWHVPMDFYRLRKKSSRPTVPCDGPRMNRQVDVGNPPRPFRHLRMTERRTPDPSSSRVPVHSALVQKSVTAITNPAGRLSLVMLGELPAN